MTTHDNTPRISLRETKKASDDENYAECEIFILREMFYIAFPPDSVAPPFRNLLESPLGSFRYSFLSPFFFSLPLFEPRSSGDMREGERASYWSNFRRDFRRVAVHAAYSVLSLPLSPSVSLSLSLSLFPRSSSRKGNCRGNSKVRAIPYEFQSTLVPRPPSPASARIITRARESRYFYGRHGEKGRRDKRQREIRTTCCR